MTAVKAWKRIEKAVLGFVRKRSCTSSVAALYRDCEPLHSPDALHRCFDVVSVYTCAPLGVTYAVAPLRGGSAPFEVCPCLSVWWPVVRDLRAHVCYDGYHTVAARVIPYDAPFAGQREPSIMCGGLGAESRRLVLALCAVTCYWSHGLACATSRPLASVCG